METGPARFVRIAEPALEPAPLMGEHTREIARTLLDLSAAQIEKMIASGVLEDGRQTMTQTMTTATQPITTLDEFEQEFRKGVGEWLSPNPPKEASLDNIRRFGDGVGDYNPLWRDPDHAAASRFGAITAPPILIYGVALGIRASIYGAIDPARLSSRYFPMNYAGGTIDFISADLARRHHHRTGAGVRRGAQDQRAPRPLLPLLAIRDLHQPAPGAGGHQDHVDGPLPQPR